MCETVRGETYGYPAEVWESAKREAIRAIVAEGRKGLTIPYSILAGRISSIGFGPHDFAFHHLLGEISVEEDAAGRGMLSALVVHRDDGAPGSGFFDLARSMGRDVRDQDRFWSDEVRRVFGHCKLRPVAA